METTIKILILVEFRYHDMSGSGSPFKVEKYNYTIAESVQGTIEKGDELLNILTESGYKPEWPSFKIDGYPNSYRGAVKCNGKGCEAIVKTIDFNIASAEWITKIAKETVEKSDDYNKCLVEEYMNRTWIKTS